MIEKNKRFCIVGLGLLGGSYAKGLKEKGYIVDAIDLNEESIHYACENHLIDSGSTHCEELLPHADFVILGLYPTLIVEWIKTNQYLLKENVFITDVSGVKRAIVEDVQAILRDDLEFIASHPMAGREVSGVKFSNTEMFKVANFIITPTAQNTPQGIAFVNDLAQLLEFKRITTLTCEEHDKMIGFLSQLTHVIAVTLMNTNDNSHLVEYTGDSFRDLTRIAKINENLWSELFLLNKDYLLEEIDDFMKELSHFRDTLYNDDTEEMKRLFIQSTNRRKYFDQ